MLEERARNKEEACVSKYKGSCHCGTVTFEVEAPDHIEVIDCNCSICTKAGYLHLIIPGDDFTLLTGEDNLTHYSFNTGTARHSFCKTCGVKSFYTPRSNPEDIDVNLRCLDEYPKSFNLTRFDGQNWEENAEQLAEIQQANR